MSDVIYDNVKLVVEFTPKEGALESGETVQELFGKTAGHIADTEIHTTAAEKINVEQPEQSESADKPGLAREHIRKNGIPRHDRNNGLLGNGY